MIYKRLGKRILDTVASGLGLLVLSPLFVLIGIVIWIKLGRPIFFTQVRPGLNAKPFTMVKFRTMKDLRDSDGNVLPDDLRLTKLGKFLRSTSLDELPELWNVLKGDMSLVGPRPLLMEYLSLYNKEQTSRHVVRPGVTGLAQVNGRNSISWENRFELDVFYVKNISLFLDIKIIFLTIIKVLLREGIDYGKEMEDKKFKGSKEQTKKNNLN
jgi:lipopolysaccharide/colanic/teichoic acid biosynthesis glycosyltransferase